MEGKGEMSHKHCYFCDRKIREEDSAYDPWKDNIILCPICYGKYMRLVDK